LVKTPTGANHQVEAQFRTKALTGKHHQVGRRS